MPSLLKVLYKSWLILGLNVSALKFDEQYVGFNLNENETAINPLDYSGVWENHTYHPSPSNWRFPFYTIFLDKFVNGDPGNDDANGTLFEHDVMQTQLRHGGDIQGVIDSLDYIQGMGIKGLYIAGSPFINQPWEADSYSPLDFTLLDLHYGNISKYREMVTEVHNRGMYVIADNTMATMGDLNAFEGFLNSSTPFSVTEHRVVWRDPNRQYLDFKPNNEYNETCDYPRFWNETGFPVDPSITAQFKGCYNSEFDQYGDTEAFGVHPDYQRQLSKFASVQDRLREWLPSVRDKIKHFSCLAILMLDVDGFRIDKATQITVDALGDFSDSVRECARSVGKDNFFIPGEITGGNTFGSVYLGRGRQPDMLPPDLDTAVTLTNASNSSLFIRAESQNALDSAAFHYSVYRALTRFLGMDGNLESGYDTPVDFVDAWNEMLITNDLINPNTNEIDVRHMYGVSNQDVFRWPAITNGREKQMLGTYITTLHMPGIPLVLWGEEQGFYILDNTANNYVFGRQAMSSATAWQLHGCYNLGSLQYFTFPAQYAENGCHDEWNSLDHRDTSHPMRNIIKSMYQMRENYPVLNDGIFLQRLSKMTRQIFLPGSGTTPTELGMWSTLRSRFPTTQDLSGTGQGNQSVWLVYQNDNTTINYEFNCSDNDTALISPFDSNTTVKNLFYPFEELSLKAGPIKLGLEGSLNFNGCLDNMTLNAWEFKAFVPKDKWVGPGPMITNFLPGHDARIKSEVAPGKQETVQIQLHFSQAMDCQALASSLEISSTTEDKRTASLDNSTVVCADVSPQFLSNLTGSLPTVWTFSANLTNVSNGVHTIAVVNATTRDGSQSTGTTDRFIFRTGQVDNPIVFPQSANYTLQLLHQNENGTLFISHKAAGADLWRYTLDWSHFSDWMPYTGGNDTLQPKNWTGTTTQAWEGEHIIVQYHSQISGSSDYVQHADLATYTGPARRFPHLFAEGPFNQYGYDAGVANAFELNDDFSWTYHFMTEWPTIFQINEWGINPDGFPDQTGVFGDADNDSVIDRMPPSALAAVVLNMTTAPPMPFLGWDIQLNDGTFMFVPQAAGDMWIQIAIFIISAVVPIITGVASIWGFMRFFYDVKHNEEGITEKKAILPIFVKRLFQRDPERRFTILGGNSANVSTNVLAQDAGGERRSVLIATMEYDIEDWGIKIKIGGLGVMAQLMGKNLGHQDLIWVVPCVGGVDYPEDEPAEPMYITILGSQYEVQVQYHKLRNITYVLLDAPVFRSQTKAEPYPARMDDLNSAVYYSSWNQCIAQTLRRFHVDLYHINDYHGAVAPLHLLPSTIPVCLSLHNAEFQGLWPLRTAKEFKEVCEVFNLKPELVQKYVQFGDVFNLLHAGSSYLRLHQRGFGAVGVSKKYGARSHARYPIFWGLNRVGHLPNPDPTDLGEWNGVRDTENVVVDEEFEASRPELKRQAQAWAGLDQNPQADLLVFVGRWSMQKGIDLIADVMPAILEENQNVQLICVGPVIDLYGKFAALKLDIMMQKYKGRVFSRPEFTQLPPYIFSGAEFALIPSRDEPFGLVAVEFGRKGALGIGARVGGLGNMPGWWYTVESTTTSHLLHQFKVAIKDALASKNEVRRIMRAKSAKQRFPVAVWVNQLESLQSTAIKIHEKEALKSITRPSSGRGRSSFLAPFTHSRSNSRNASTSRAPTEREGDQEQRDSSADPQSSVEQNDSEETRGNSTESDSGQDRDQSASHSREPSDQSSSEWPLPNIPRGSLLEVPSLPNTPRHNSFSPGLTTPAEPSTPAQQQSLLPNESEQSSGDYFSSPSPPDVRFVPRSTSELSMDQIVGEKKDFLLQRVDPDFTDSRGDYYKAFEKLLGKLNGSNSEDSLCIEQYLVRSEREWYGQFKAAKLGRFSVQSTPASSLFRKSRPPSISPTVASTAPSHTHDEQENYQEEKDQWLLGDDYKPPRGIKLFMQRRIGDWPVYSFFLALGQIIAANSYQITLLSGTIGQTADKLYIIASIYLGSSMLWWIMLRSFKSVYVLSLPFLFYGLAFLLLGIAPFAPSTDGRGWVQNVATGLYAAASSSGSIYFALNFGDEGGAPVRSWTFRACVIQGTQQIYVCALWAWGDYITKIQATGAAFGGIVTTSSRTMTAIAIPIAVLLWAIGIVIFAGLPSYYRQAPGKVPSFYLAMFRRKIVIWFFVVVIIQNYFLSASTGRNWQFLFQSQHAATWQIACLVILFFIFIWIGILWLFGYLSKAHSWILPMFAIGLGAPRWAQILWSCSNIGFWLPWTGSPLASALVSRAVWLWLGTLDALQGVGFGMILLQTLTRLHITYTLIAAQVLGSLATIAARATAPNRIGPGDLFPDFTRGIFPGAGKAWFWIGLVFQLVICTGFFRFFRKEQLSKP